MCIACELQFFLAMEDLPPSTGTASHDKMPADDAPRFACDAPEAELPKPAEPPAADERKP